MRGVSHFEERENLPVAAVLDVRENGRYDLWRRVRHAAHFTARGHRQQGQCTPGIIAVNTATFIGQKLRGVAGGITATLGVVFPSLVIISLLAGLITSFSHLTWVQDTFSGVQVCVCVLIFNAVVKLLKKSVIDKRTAGIFLIVLVGGVVLNISPVWFVVAAAVAGVILKNWEARSK